MSWDLLGHEWAEKLLQKHIANGETRHAYLFTGAPGIGRRSLVLAFARALNCTNPPSPGDSCGICRICTQIDKLQQPDLSIVEPESEAGMIKVGQIRNLQHSLSLTPYEARYRVALLVNFQYANPSAQNALLKTLEEAPTQVILLLTADSADNLLPTIASRCEILRLRPVAVETLSDALQTRWKVPLKEARLYASLSNGRVGLARRMMLDSSILEKRLAWLDELLRLLPLNRRERFAAVDTLARQRDQLRLVLQAWLSFARDLLLVSSGLVDRVTNIDLLDEINVCAGKMNSGQPLELVNALSRSLEYLDMNANLRLVMDNLVLEIPHLR